MQIGWLEKPEEPVVRQEISAMPSVGDIPPEEDDRAVPVTRRRPPRLPGALETIPPVPLEAAETKPPPPRRNTTEVEMSWVELSDEEAEAELGGQELNDEGIPDLSPRDEEKPEITRVEAIPESTQRLEAEREAARREAESRPTGPPPALAVTAPPPPAPPTATPTEEELRLAREEAERIEAEAAERAREEVLAARKREQDARDREIRLRRKAEREKERLAQEAVAARAAQEKKEEEERLAAMRQGRPDNQILDLSGIDDEIDFALDAVLGPNLSHPPPPPDDKDKK